MQEKIKAWAPEGFAPNAIGQKFTRGGASLGPSPQPFNQEKLHMRGVPKYEGRRVEIKGQSMPEVEVQRPNGEVLDPKPSQKIWNYSPTGFEWGYGGSGPSQLALALSLD